MCRPMFNVVSKEEKNIFYKFYKCGHTPLEKCPGSVYELNLKKPKHTYFTCSTCPSPPRDCDWSAFTSNEPNIHLLQGALVGGPGEDDSFRDDRADFKSNMVSCDTNAGFQSAVAGECIYTDTKTD